MILLICASANQIARSMQNSLATFSYFCNHYYHWLVQSVTLMLN